MRLAERVAPARCLAPSSVQGIRPTSVSLSGKALSWSPAVLAFRGKSATTIATAPATSVALNCTAGVGSQPGGEEALSALPN